MKNFFHVVCLGVCLFLGTLASAQTILVENLNTPYDVIGDQDGHIYISDTYNRRIIKTNSDGSNPIVLNTFSGTVYGLLISNNKLFALVGGNLIKMNLDGTDPQILVPAPGVYYLASGNDNYIYFIGNQSKNLQKVKEDGTGHTTIASLVNPMGVTYDPNLDLLYYTDNGAVYSIKRDGTDKQFILDGFYNPHNLRLDSSGNIYIAVTSSNWIRKISADRKTVTTFPNTSLNAPTSTFVTKNGNILISDTWGNKIRSIDAPAATSLNFDGIDDYISGTNSRLPQGANEVTIEAVVKTSSDKTGSIFDFGSFSQFNRFCMLSFGGKLTFMGDGHGVVSDVQLNDNKWHHVAITYKNNQIKIYADGTLVKQDVLYNLNITGSQFHIGASNRNGIDELFEGDIDEVRVWNRALSENELKNSKNCEVSNPVSKDGLVSYFKFNQGNNEADNNGVTTLIDETGKSTSVTLNNFALTGAQSNWLLSSPIVAGNSCPPYVAPLSCATVTLPSNGVSPNVNPTVSWSAVASANSYKVFVGTSSGNYDIISAAYVSSTNFVLEGLSESTTYYVKIVPDSSTGSAIGCTESSFTTGTYLSVGSAGKNSISLYPNPFTNEIHLSNLEEIVSVTVNDNSGKLLKTVKPSKIINLSSLTQGLYIINVKLTDGTSKSFKAIKK